MTSDRQIERVLGRVLRIGITLSTASLGVGLLLSVTGTRPGIASDLLGTGLVLLLGTPAARVAVSIVEYASARDWLFATLAGIVLLELGASLVPAMYDLRF